MSDAKHLHKAITYSRLPERWKNRKIFGKGTTSIVFSKDDQNIDMLTRDAMKVEFLVSQYGFKLIEKFSLNHRNKNINHFIVHHLKGPRFTKAPDQEFLINLEKDHRNFVFDILRHYNPSQHYELYYKHFLITKNHPMKKAVDFKYQHAQTNDIFLDIHRSNFMVDQSGLLIGNDLIFDQRLYDVLRKY